MKKQMIFAALLAAWLTGCATNTVSRTDHAMQPTSLYEISLQKVQPGLPNVVVDTQQTLRFKRRTTDEGYLVSTSETMVLPAGKFKPMGQTPYGLFYESPTQLSFVKSSGGLGGIVIPSSGQPAKVWVADFRLGVSGSEINANVTAAFLSGGILITPFIFMSPMVRGKESLVLLQYLDSLDAPLQYRFE